MSAISESTAGKPSRRSWIKFLSTPPIACLLLAIAPALWTDTRAAESSKTGSRTPFRHIIPLRDAEGELITPPPALDEQGKPQEATGNPFSTAQTCGRCHEYSAIAQGWHFNAGKTNVPSGRPGEPWILTDPATRTQIPLSYRGWPGTFQPADLGLSDFDFLVHFARHYPGGGVGEPAKDRLVPDDPKMRRFLVTGALEIDCLICHNQHGHYDHEARYKALANENFKWSATIASELGAYGAPRSAKTFADSWRPPRPAPARLPPTKYDRQRFDAANQVAFDVTRRPPVTACYYCHTSQDRFGDARWHSDGDVHIRAGMTCVDCHRNGIDHQVVRGYDGETADRRITDDTIAQRVEILLRDRAEISADDARKLAEAQLRSESGLVETLSCRGCHYGSTDGQFAGRLGAPHPEHKGLPPIHFEKLTCTACHSGSWPEATTRPIQTSLAHKLGIPAPTRGEETAPVIVQPVFLHDANGRIAPHKAVWPSYWGFLGDGRVIPLPPEDVTKVAGDAFPTQTPEDVKRDPHNTRPLTDDQIKTVLTALATARTNAEPVFLAAGKMFRLVAGELKAAEHDAAKPYAWAMGHDVRPASQSLGIKGCSDCHDSDSPIYFATVGAHGPTDPTHRVAKPQWAMRGDGYWVPSVFAFTFHFRPLLKIITLACALIVLGVMARRLLLGSRANSPDRTPNS